MGNAYFIPILQEEQKGLREYITVPEALKEGLLELKDSGRIDAVLVINKATEPVLFIAGMDVHAKGTQSRIIIGSHLVPPKTKLELPCRCTHDVHPIRMYRSLMTDVDHYSVASPSVRGSSIAKSVAGQDRVWAKVRDHREKLKTSYVKGKALLDEDESSTRLSDVQSKASQSLRDELAQITPRIHQIGLAVISDAAIQTIEIFDNPDTYQQFHNHLIQRFAFEIAAPKPTSKRKLRSLQSSILKELRRLGQQLDIEEGKGTAQRRGKIMGTLQNKDRKLVHLCLEKL